MKKISYPLVAALSLSAIFIFGGVPRDGQAAESELRPTQKIMQARAGWMKAMNTNLSAMHYEEVKKDALALSAQATSVTEKQPEGLAKELTTKLATLSTAAAEAAGNQKGEVVKTKLAEMQATCAECHAKIRDKQ